MNLSHYAQPAKLRTLLLTTTTLLMLLALLSPSASAARAVVKATSSNEWSPAAERIEKGDSIVWKNPNQATHNIVSYGSNWSFERYLYAGDTFTKRFRSTGTYKYRCSIHSTKQNGQCEGMCGVIRVVRP